MLGYAQVTQINNNKSLVVTYPLSSTKTIIVSEIDSSIWVSDATLPGTVQISPSIKYEGYGGVLGSSFIFRGSTVASGSEIYKTDGTSGGTVLVKDIIPGTVGCRPGDFTIFNGFLYFSAVTTSQGRELWRTDGTGRGTTLFKDIKVGTDSSNNIDQYHLTATPTYLLFAAQSASEGIELWMSNGTNAGTVLLKDINTGHAGSDSSNPRDFYYYNNMVLFFATDATNGEELWKSDGTVGGTSLVKDINPGTGGSASINYSPAPGFNFAYPLFSGFHTFNNKVYFNAYDGTSTGEIWSSDGTPGNTVLLKNIIPATFDPMDPLPYLLVVNAVNLPSKFIFSVSNYGSQNELWECDGSSGGTKLFKAFTPNDPTDIPFLYVPYSYNGSGVISQQLFGGNKFFFTAGTTAQGYELWISDGTIGGTNVVKDIYPGASNGIDNTTSLSYLYTKTALFFAATDATHGNELWKTDGTSGNTTLVKDIFPNAGDAAPQLSLLNSAGTIFFTATDGDDPDHRDLFVVDGVFEALPLQLADFTVISKASDALLQWRTSQELNTKDFTVQRSYDAQNFENIGSINAFGISTVQRNYSFTDPGIIHSGKTKVYYRLLSTDVDGKMAYSKVILLKLKDDAVWSVHMLANPVRGSVNVILEGITGTVKLSLKDVNGRIIFTNTYQNTNGQLSLDANLQHGTYLLIAEKNNERKVIKFVK